MPGPKEAAYDEHIAPLMEQIIKLCDEHKINAAATFSLTDENGSLFCTTILPNDPADEVGYERVVTCRRVMYPPPAMLFSYMATSPKEHPENSSE